MTGGRVFPVATRGTAERKSMGPNNVFSKEHNNAKINVFKGFFFSCEKIMSKARKRLNSQWD